MSNENNSRSAMIAAAAILVGVSLALLLMPKIVLWLGGYSPFLGFAFGALVILAFFLIFWLRSRYQRRR